MKQNNSQVLPSYLKENRLPALDILRAVAILLVLGNHMLWIPELGGGWEGAVFRYWIRGGWIGVDLFFVLSGFLVGGLLIREYRLFGTIQPVNFLLRRGLKIYPSFYAFLFVSVLASRAVGMTFESWPAGLWSEVFFLQNYLPGLWPQMWSLAVEEHFYLLLVGVLFWMIKKSQPQNDALAPLSIWIFFINALVLVGRLIAAEVSHSSWSALTFQTQWRLDSLLFGLWLAIMVDRHPTKVSRGLSALRPWRFIVIPILLGPSFILNQHKDHYVWTFGATALYLGFGWILMEVVHSRRTWTFIPLRIGSSILQGIGRHSYSIYLWHFTLYYIGFTFIHRKLGLHFSLTANCLGFLCAAILWGILMSKAIEQPVLRLRNRWFPSRTVPEINGAPLR